MLPSGFRAFEKIVAAIKIITMEMRSRKKMAPCSDLIPSFMHHRTSFDLLFFDRDARVSDFSSVSKMTLLIYYIVLWLLITACEVRNDTSRRSNGIKRTIETGARMEKGR